MASVSFFLVRTPFGHGGSRWIICRPPLRCAFKACVEDSCSPSYTRCVPFCREREECPLPQRVTRKRGLHSMGNTKAEWASSFHFDAPESSKGLEAGLENANRKGKKLGRPRIPAYPREKAQRVCQRRALKPGHSQEPEKDRFLSGRGNRRRTVDITVAKIY